MKKVLMLALIFVASFGWAQNQIPWADSIIHTDPVLERGLGPEMVSPGYSLAVLTDLGRNGETVDRYIAWTSGRSGGRVVCAFRPGEPVEAKCTGKRVVGLGGKNYEVETWEAKRLVRCGNPTAITFYRWYEMCSSPALPPPITNVASSTTVIVSTQTYASSQMLGVSSPSYNTMPLLMVNTTVPVRINNENNNSTAVVNNVANNNLVNVGSGTVKGNATATGDAISASK